MPVDLNAPVDALITFLKTLPGLADEADGTKHVHKGVPASIPARLTVYVLPPSFGVPDTRTNVYAIQGSIIVDFCYRVEGATAGATEVAETALLTAVGAFIPAMKMPANRDLGALPTTPDETVPYQQIASQEFRVMRFRLAVTQSHNF